MPTAYYDVISSPDSRQSFNEANLRAHLRDACMWTQQEIDRAIRDADRNGEHRHVTPLGTTRIKPSY
jgi:hypothetical protein